ncbi:7TM diverse intracellular signaling domain-containing protein [Leptospira bouyouniensis]|uniref:7TM diverse intracellular signaling domain-containing protein n=1 Tax=Leptospira bouyouniensis TaxID=2484911 RepID=UPI00142D582F|nr:7TM diverse intracellular signaling domain-containing protein [Leptospira bouyouniensis]
MKYLIAILFILFDTNCYDTNPVAIKGIIDFNGNFTQSIISLNGEWEFYHNQRIDQIEPNSKFYVQMPSLWNNDPGFVGDGYGVYQLKMINVPKVPLALHIPEMYSSYNVYANERLIAKSGLVGNSKEATIPSFDRNVVGLQTENQEIRLSIEVANFHFPRGGIPSSLRIGEYSAIKAYREKGIAESVFLSGAAFMLGLYHLIAYLIFRKDKPFLFFGIFCLNLSLRPLLINEQYLVEIFPSISWIYWQKIEFLNFLALLPFFYHFIRVSYTKEPQSIFSKSLNVIFISLAILVVFSDPIIFANIPVPVYLLIGAAVFDLTRLLIKQIKLGDKGAKVVFLFFIFLAIIVLIEILIERNILRGFHFIEVPGFIIFLISQAYVLSLHTEKLRVEKNQADLEILNERRRNLRLELSFSTERERILSDLHDHLGAKLTDLSIRIEYLKPNQTLTEADIDFLKMDVKNCFQSFRDTIYDNDDFRIMTEDFMYGLQLNLTRRYARTKRELRFETNEHTRIQLQKIDNEELKRNLYAITVEIATNDLKYGSNATYWNFDLDENGLNVKMDVDSNFKNSGEFSIGTRSIQRRLESLNARWTENNENNHYTIHFFIPIPNLRN